MNNEKEMVQTNSSTTNSMDENNTNSNTETSATAVPEDGNIDNETEGENTPEQNTAPEEENIDEDGATPEEENIDEDGAAPEENIDEDGAAPEENLDGQDAAPEGEDVTTDGANEMTAMDNGEGMGEDGAYMEETTAESSSLMSSYPFVIGTSLATVVLGAVLGFILAKKKIKKGFDSYED